MTEKKYYTRIDWRLIAWQNWQKSWREKIQRLRFCLISKGVRAVLTILIRIKTLLQYKDCLEINLWKKKKKRWNISESIQNFLKLRCLVVDNLLDFLELPVFINASLPYLIYYLMTRQRTQTTKKHFVKYHFYLFFLNCYGWLKLVTCG